MNFQIFSDLHITFNSKIPFITPTAPYLILAGDIGKFGDENYIKFIQYVSKKWNKVFYVLGNHEFYIPYEFNTVIKLYEKLFQKYNNIILLNRSSYQLDDYLIVGCTCWTDISTVKDFSRPIYFKTKDGLKWDLKKYNKNRMKDIKFLCSFKTQKKVILITHFPLINKWTYNKTYSNKYFFKKKWLVNNFNIKYLPFYKNLKTVISGHTHYSYDFNYKNVRFISNQYGYSKYGNNLNKINGKFKLSI